MEEKSVIGPVIGRTSTKIPRNAPAVKGHSHVGRSSHIDLDRMRPVVLLFAVKRRAALALVVRGPPRRRFCSIKSAPQQPHKKYTYSQKLTRMSAISILTTTSPTSSHTTLTMDKPSSESCSEVCSNILSPQNNSKKRPASAMVLAPTSSAAPGHNDQNHHNDMIKLKSVRDKVIRIIESKLSKTNGQRDAPTECITSIAKALEEKLYSTSKSNQTYCDMSTLDERIRVLVTAQLQRRLLKKCRENRTQQLKEIVGLPRYKIVYDLVQDIKIQKNEKVASMECLGGGSSTLYNNMNDPTPPMTAKTCSRPFKETLPLPVRKLFFETKLVEVFEKSPISSAKLVNWDELIHEAKTNLEKYLEWNGGRI